MTEDLTSFTYNAVNDYPLEEESSWKENFRQIKNDYMLQKNDIPMYFSNLAVNEITRK